MARARNIGNLYAELNLRDGFSRGLRRARKSLNAFGRSGMRYASLGTAAMAAGMVIGSKRALAMGAELDHLSTQTGVGVAGLMKIGQAYKDNGRDAKSAAKDIGKMQKAIFDQAENPTSELNYFEELGLSAKELMKLTPEEQFFQIGDAIKGVEDDTKRAAAAMGIFGRSGAGLVTVFQGTSLEDVNRSLGRAPALLEKYSGAFERVDTLLGRLPNKSDQFFTGFTTGVVGEILPALEKTNEFDFTTLGENLGKSLGHGLALVKDGTVWDLFALHADKALVTIQASPGINGLAAAITTLTDGVEWDAWAIRAERAMLKVQKSPALNGLAAFQNALLDFAAPDTWDADGNYDFGKAFDKYAAAGKHANAELVAGLTEDLAALETFGERFAKNVANGAASVSDEIEAIQAKMDRLNERSARKFEKRRAEAEARGGAAGVPAGEAQTEAAGVALGQSSANISNEYQRRGLALGGDGSRTGSKLDQQTEILRKMLAALTGPAVWKPEATF